MRFNEWVMLSSRLRQGGVPASGDPVELLKQSQQMELPDSLRQNVAAEHNWHQMRKPYYHMYPIAVNAIANLRLDVAWSHIRLPVRELLFQFADGHEVDIGDGRRLRSMLVADTLRTSKVDARWIIFADCGETERNSPVPIFSTLFLVACDEWTVEESIEVALRRGLQKEHSGQAGAAENELFARTVARVLAGAALLSGDPSMIQPEVLNRDELRAKDADQETIDRLAARAIARGKYGWSFGKAIESIPHFRRPHFGLRWCGVGRMVPRIVPIKGAVVHREKATKLPTGLKDDTSKSSDVLPALELQKELHDRLDRPSN